MHPVQGRCVYNNDAKRVKRITVRLQSLTTKKQMEQPTKVVAQFALHLIESYEANIEEVSQKNREVGRLIVHY